MNLDQTTVPLQPRRALGCLDVGMRFYGRHFGHMLRIWSIVALPAGVLVYLLTIRFQRDVRLTLIVLYAATWVCSVLTVAGTARAVFGQSFLPEPDGETRTDFLRVVLTVVNLAGGVALAVVAADVAADMFGTDFVFGEVQTIWYWGLFAALTARMVLHLVDRGRMTPGFWKALVRAGVRRALLIAAPLLLLFFVNWYLALLGGLLSIIALVAALRTSFLPESIFLASLDEKLHGRGTRDLLKKEGSDLFGRSLAIVPFCLVLSLIVFFTIDWSCEQIGYPILAGRLDQVLPGAEVDREADGAHASDPIFGSIGRIGYGVTIAAKFLLTDSRCLAVLTAAILFVFPIARLAWFFCYIDLRVRRDCWDMELLFQQEARRLERAA